jgi:hypothetical protein
MKSLEGSSFKVDGVVNRRAASRGIDGVQKFAVSFDFSSFEIPRFGDYERRFERFYARTKSHERTMGDRRSLPIVFVFRAF